MSAREVQAMQSLTPEQAEALHAYWLALKLHEGRYLTIPRIVQVASPAAGADWSTSVPAGKTWQLMTVGTLFTASAATATRASRIVLTDTNGNRFGGFPPGNSVTAGAGSRLFWAQGYGTSSTLSGSAASLPTAPNPLVQGTTIATETVSIQAGDQWSSIFLYVLETRERTPNEVVDYMEDLIAGTHVDLYPGLLLGF